MAKDKNKPVAFWVEKERVKNKILDCLTLILRTRGCSWSKCLMCGFHSERSNVNSENLLNQINYAVSRKNFQVLKIFTSGSFFDDREVPPEVRDYVFTLVKDMGLDKLIVESRPEFIMKAKFERNFNFEFEVGIGLETSNDFIRENCINKGFSFEDFKKSAEKLKSLGIKVRTYLLLKPPFLSEKEAIEDCINSARDVCNLTDTISINPVYIPKDTYIEKLWKAGIYRPPWLWSALEILKSIKEICKSKNIVCDPVGAGSKRAIHNCGKYDKEIAHSIKSFSVTQDLEDLIECESIKCKCKCYNLWKKYIDFEQVCRFPV